MPDSPLRSTRKPRKPRLARYRLLCGSAALVACSALVGCSTPSATSGGSKGFSLPWSKQAENKPTTYEQLAKEQQQRKINSPALGLDQAIEPNPIQTAASSVGASMKEGADKLASVVTPKPQPPTETSSKSLWPFAKKETVSANFYISLAQVYEQKEPDQAAAQYEKALSVDPKNLDALLAYAHLEDRIEHIEKAISLYQRAMAAHPKDPRPLNDLGLCYARHERYDDALTCLNKAIKLKPDRELYRNNVAMVLVKMDRPEDAVQQISAVYGEAVARYNVALMLNTQGKRDAAIAQIVKSLQLSPNLAQAKQWLAELSGDNGQEQLAEMQTPGVTDGPVAVAGGATEDDEDSIPEMATPTSATIETARAPRASGGQSNNLITPTARPRAPQSPSASAPRPPSPRVTQTSAARAMASDDSDGASDSQATRAVQSKATASDAE